MIAKDFADVLAGFGGSGTGRPCPHCGVEGPWVQTHNLDLPGPVPTHHAHRYVCDGCGQGFWVLWLLQTDGVPFTMGPYYITGGIVSVSEDMPDVAGNQV